MSSCGAKRQGAYGTSGFYFCTLEMGHQGDHIAQGTENQVCFQWPQEAPSDPRGQFESLNDLGGLSRNIGDLLSERDLALDEFFDTGSYTLEAHGRRWVLTLNVKEVK